MRRERTEVRKVVEFIRQHGSRRFRKWPLRALLMYLRQRYEDGSLVLVSHYSEVIAFGVGYRCARENVEDVWARPDPMGELFFIAEIASTDFAGLAILMWIWLERNNTVPPPVVCGFRGGKLKPYSWEYVCRVLRRATEAEAKRERELEEEEAYGLKG